ncbi:MAG: VCBS repeat-containing protein [Bacteroidota bacterium]
MRMSAWVGHSAGWLFFFSILVGCENEHNQSEALFELISSEHSGVHFSNTITESDSLSILTFDYIYNGGGVAIGDINNDSLPDIFFTGNQVSCKLYLNKGNFQFEDVTKAAGLETSVWAEGATMADVNQDGYLDIYVCTSNREPNQLSANLLFINTGAQSSGNLAFTEQASKYGIANVGYNTQATFFDYDRDGDLDLYLLNNATGESNKNTTRRKRLNGEATSTDHLYRNEAAQPSDSTVGQHPVFTDVSRAAGILTEGYGLGLALGDLNKDGWTDLYTSNDFLSNDILYLNTGKGGFSNEISHLLKHQSYNGMGVDVVDINNDGWLDIFELDMLPETNRRQKLMFGSMNYDRFKLNLRMGYEPQYVRNTFQLNNGVNPSGKAGSQHISFSEIAQLAGVHSTDWSWSTLLADYDNDGFRDLLITNGYGKDITDQDYTVYSRAVSQFGTEKNIRMQLREGLEKITEVKLKNYLYKNNGASGQGLTFSNQSEAWGMRDLSISNGAAYADLDRDGDLDLVINNLNQEAFIYRNNAEKLLKNHFLQLELVGDSLNITGIGAKVQLHYQGKTQYAEHFTTRGYKSSMDPTIHFGLGKLTTIDSLEITWPSGQYQLLRNVRANQRLTLYQKDAESPTSHHLLLANTATPIFKSITNEVALTYRHQEKDFSDFRVQPLIPFKHSQSGPGLAVADVNGDGLEDFYVGGASEQAGMVFYQQSNGKFRSTPLPKANGYEEDMGALFFDADNDRDMDLYVVSGSSEFPIGSRYYQDRLYKNDGQGNLRLDKAALPTINTSGSCVVAADYDRDGDLDVFVGGRVAPGQYPLPPQSYLLQNNGGIFRDVTEVVCPELKKIGMVTSALWTDFDNDQQPDLLLVGEWMPITFFKNQHGKLIAWSADAGKTDQRSTQSLKNSSGWWNSLAAGDFDNDGDIDYIAGNLGLNSKFKASDREPVSLFAKDFDRNGSLDPMLCYYIQGKNYPAPPRDDMIDQIVAMRKQFPRYADYAKATFDQIFTPESLQDAYMVQAQQLQSCYLENLGKGKFKLLPLPIRAQFAPVFGLLVQDFDGDGNLDVLLSGNSYASEILTGWYDASIGLYLRGDGKGHFLPLSAVQSGFFVDKDAKGLAQLPRYNGTPLVLAACNDDSLRVFATALASRWLSAAPSDLYAEVMLPDKRTRREEFYYGSGYLSQSARGIWISPQAKRVKIYDSRGKAREWKR